MWLISGFTRIPYPYNPVSVLLFSVASSFSLQTFLIAMALPWHVVSLLKPGSSSLQPSLSPFYAVRAPAHEMVPPTSMDLVTSISLV